MSANIQLINSMFKLSPISPISASAKLQPFEELEPEVPPVKLVTELVKGMCQNTKTLSYCLRERSEAKSKHLT